MTRVAAVHVRLVQSACLKLPLLDPQVARELGIVATNLLDKRSASSRRMKVSTAGGAIGLPARPSTPLVSHHRVVIVYAIVDDSLSPTFPLGARA
jgi:hypothetical protein